MNMQVLVGIIVVLVLAGGGFYFFSGRVVDDSMHEDEAMTEDAGSMADNEAMVADDSMQSDDSGMEDIDTMSDGEGMMQKGSYETYAPEKLARANDGTVVLFFRASWCPTCKALDADIRAHLGDIPADVTILDVDYDNSTALKQKYGVTYQHTLVQVDADGNQIAHWDSSPTLAEALTHIK